ncbi:electron transfer flavoprotein subunit alpha/FixB family protein [uncultured Ilyobacter sp.]|uniref:electron transfer flavoprotein subunit alpha/FixB family protein n=1 Tax=uncultured Ilyobacter sp. TaxID=544433 RepID=UPI0029F53B91|nr:electron transfer flavoprotein subunit alpha/FixB family protein [uncultured Ilyobacter sp.]
MNKALIYIECRENKINPITFQLLGKVLNLNKNCEVIGVLIGENTEMFNEELNGYPFKTIYGYNTEFSTEGYAKILTLSIKESKPELVLIGSSDFGKNIAGLVAISLETGLTADCTDLRMDEKGNVIQIRPAFGGDIMGEILTENHRPQMATVRNNIFNPVEKNNSLKTNFIYKNINMDSRITVLDKRLIIPDVDITNEKKLIAIGNGFKKIEDMENVEKLAGKLGFTICCSRVVVEKGFLPQNRQIGLSGKAVSPDIMITLGVSGSVQFMAGVKKVKKLIAVNNDESARIFNYAHYGILGDIYDVIPEIIKIVGE